MYSFTWIVRNHLESAIEAAIDFVEVCCQHTAYVTGRGDIYIEVDLVEAGM